MIVSELVSWEIGVIGFMIYCFLADGISENRKYWARSMEIYRKFFTSMMYESSSSFWL
jgi:hypothetical protein